MRHARAVARRRDPRAAAGRGPTLCTGVVLPRPLRVRGLLPRSKVRKVIKRHRPCALAQSSLSCALQGPGRPAPAGPGRPTAAGPRGAADRPARSAPSPRAGATQPPPRHGTLSNVATFTPTHSAHPQTGQSWTHARHSHAVSINLCQPSSSSCTPPCSSPTLRRVAPLLPCERSAPAARTVKTRKHMFVQQLSH